MKKFLIFLLLFPFIFFAQKPQLVIKSGLQSELIMASISPDNKIGLTVEVNETLILWELSTGKQLQSFPNIMAADFRLDNKTIDVVTNQYKFQTIDYAGKVISQSPINNTGNDKNNRFNWSYYRKSALLLNNASIYTRENGYRGTIRINKFGIEQDYSEERNVISIPNKNDVTLCKVPSGEIIKVLNFNLAKSDYASAPILDIKFTRFSQDGRYLMAGNNNSLEVLDINTGQSIYSYTHPNDYKTKLLNLAGFSPDSKKIFVHTTNEIILINLETKKDIWRIKQGGFYISEYGSRKGVIRFSDDGKKILFGTLKNLSLLNAENGQTITKLFGVTNEEVFFHHLSESSNQLLIELDKKAVNWDLSSGAMRKVIQTTQPAFDYHLQLNQKGNKLYDFWTEIDLANNAHKDFPYEGSISNVNRTPSFMGLSFDDKYLFHIGYYLDPNVEDKYSINQDKLVVADVTTKKIIWRKKGIDKAVFAHTSRQLAAINSFKGFTSIDILDGATGNLIKKVNLPKKYVSGESLKFSVNDKYLAFQSGNGHLIVEISTEKTIEIPEILPDGKKLYYSVAFTADEQYLIASDFEGRLHFYNIQQQRWDSSKTIKAYNDPVAGVTVSKNNRYLFTNARENNVKLWDLQTGELLATLYPNPSTSDWAVVTPNGQFDASANAQKDLYFVKGINTFPLEILYEKYYTPKLLARLLAGERFPSIDADFDDLHKAPICKISYEQKTRNLTVEDDTKPSYENTTGLAEITVNATAENDKIDEIRLFHNGKIVNLATRGLFVTDNTTGTDTKKYTINLLAGQNIFRAIALNSQRTESQPDEIIVNYKAGNQPNNKPNIAKDGGIIDPVDKNATLHLVVVGINKYQNEKLSLNYALADATAFKDEIEKDAKTVISNVKTYFVTDTKADKNGIVNALTEVQKTAKAQDVFVFYYAGHGVISDKNKEFYLVPTDVADLKNVDEILLQKGIPSKQLQAYAVNIQAQKQVFILDACQSAGAFEQLMTSDAKQQKSLAVVARSTGTHWMAASGSKQFANEFATLGHGAFTYVLLQALKGQAANNKMITVNGLKNFIQVQVPELMKKYSGTPQYPASYGFGNDFPVEMMK